MAGKISMAARAKVIEAIRERYVVSGKGAKGAILGDFVAMTGVHRKHAIRMLTTTGVGSQPRGCPNPNWRHGATVAG